MLGTAAAIPVGHRVEVVESAGRTGRVIAITDLETGVRYQQVEEVAGEVALWSGRVTSTTIMVTPKSTRTKLLVEPIGAVSAEADGALRGADAAAAAAKEEALRWGGSEREPELESPRFW